MLGVPCTSFLLSPAVDRSSTPEHTDGMRVRASITLQKELSEVVDRYARRRKETRSAFIETALRVFVGGPTRDVQNARDLEIINQHTGSLNREACDVLEYTARR